MHIPMLDCFPATASIYDHRQDTSYSILAFRKLVTESIGKSTKWNCRVVVSEADPIKALSLLFAHWTLGNCVVLVNPGLQPIEQQTVVEHTGASDWYGDHDASIVPFMADNDNHDGAVPSKPKPLDVDQPALVLMTSGTTGTPKGIVHSIRSLNARLALNNCFIDRGVSKNTLCILPLFFGHGLIGNCLTPLAAGNALHLLPSPSLAEIAQMGSLIDNHEITFMSSVPTFWKLVLRMQRPKKRTLQRVHVGSAPLSIPNWKAVQDWTGCSSVFNMYGMTETANWIGGGSLAEAGQRDGFVGRIWGGVYAIRLENGEIAASGRGEVLVSSPSQMLGYLNAPEKTAEAMHGEWFRTGDIGELTAGGELTLVGRSKTEINRGGIKILAEEVDMMLERHDAVSEACAFGVPDEVLGEAVAVAVVFNEGQAVSKSELRSWCRTQVRAEAVPTQYIFTDAIPKNARGKIVRRDVMALLQGSTTL
ncbi:MAG: fatty acid--CoA ligase family protein [Pseudomonadota bacterium]